MIAHTKPLTHPQYRADIDGLRALAVLSVVAFHAFPSLIVGGFIGVDIFFVISGFLISGIIFSNLEHTSFSIVEFYRRRIRRIFPALLLVLISSFLFGWFFLLSDEYRALGKHIFAGSIFFSNFALWKESGYFDISSELKPLLHLWSLAIEEQFYIIWPLLMAFVWKRKWSFVAITAVIAAASFGFSIYTISKDPTAAFFSPFARIWELMLGSLLAYITLHKPRINTQHQNLQSTLGFALIACSLIFTNSTSDFPGWWALLPTFGAFFIISAGPATWFNHYILSSKLMVWFGLISYPLYLWHWPILSFAATLNNGTPAISIRLAVVIASIFLAWLTYKFVEQPIRTGSKSDLKIIAMLLLMAVVAGAGLLAFKKNGFIEVEGYGRAWQVEKNKYNDYFENRIPEMKYFTTEGMLEKYRDDCDFYDHDKFKLGLATIVPLPKISDVCFTRDPAYEHAVLVWGDSHSQQLSFGLKNNLPKNWQLMQVASSGCIADIANAQPSKTNWCHHTNWFALKTIAEVKPDVVVIARNKDHSIEYFEPLAKKLKTLGVKKVVFTGPTPHWNSSLYKIIVRQLWDNTPNRTYVGIDESILKENIHVKSKFINSDSQIYVDIIDLFCNQQGCLTYLGDDKKMGITAFDEGHLTPLASNFLAKNLLVDAIIKPATH